MYNKWLNECAKINGISYETLAMLINVSEKLESYSKARNYALLTKE